jgi:hypothetical protein
MGVTGCPNLVESSENLVCTAGFVAVSVAHKHMAQLVESQKMNVVAGMGRIEDRCNGRSGLQQILKLLRRWQQGDRCLWVNRDHPIVKDLGSGDDGKRNPRILQNLIPHLDMIPAGDSLAGV